jgi:hypothetical protein
MTVTLVLIVLLALWIGAMPSWSYSRKWGHRPATVLALLLAVVVVLVLTGTA